MPEFSGDSVTIVSSLALLQEGLNGGRVGYE